MTDPVQEHLEIVQRVDLPWSIFDKVFASGIEGMRKPDLCFFQHVIKEIGVHPSKIIMVDDTTENVCAARSQGMHALLVDKSLPSIGGRLGNLLQDQVRRAQVFLQDNAGKHYCTVEGHDDIIVKDNFSQLIIWELLGDEDIIYLKWPCGKTQGIQPSVNGHLNGHPNGHSEDRSGDNASGRSDVKNGLWNYFCESSVLTTREFPPDADTTSIGYLSLPERYLSTIADVHLVLEAMATNLDLDGIMQVYFDPTRPRTAPEVCVNILRLFHRFGQGSDPRTKKTEDYVINCLNHDACLDGSRHYSTPESFLYFVARFFAEMRGEGECKGGRGGGDGGDDNSSSSLRKNLSAITTHLQNRLNVPTNPLALALRLFACQTVDMDPHLYRQDLETFKSLQEEDGGWPPGHFCRTGRSGARIGSRGLTTALGIRILQHEREREKEEEEEEGKVRKRKHEA